MSSMATQTERMTSDDGRSHRTLGSNRIKRLDAGGINQEVVSVQILRFEEKWLRMSLRTGGKKRLYHEREWAEDGTLRYPADDRKS